MQLTPREFFTIARGLEDHTVLTTFYVRAYIRNARTDELLDTVDLVDSGDHHRYSLPWQVPADVSGQGFYILITTSVYTDAGCTTKSTTYGDRYDSYLVMDRVNANLVGFGGGSDVDYKKIQKMITEAVAKIPACEKPEMPEPIEIAPIIEMLGQIKEMCVSMKEKEMPEVDLTPVISGIRAIENKINIDEAMENNSRCLKDIGETIDQTLLEKQEKFSEAITTVETMLETIKNFFGPEVEGIVKGIDDLKKSFDEIQHVVILDKKKDDKEAVNESQD